MKIDIITIFPEMFAGPFSESIIKRATEKNAVEIAIHNLRQWTHDKHQTVDAKPFGGGPGMLMKCEPIFDCIEDLKNQRPKIKDQNLKPSNKLKVNSQQSTVIYLSPQGKPLTQTKVQELSNADHLILLCGHYEGIDQRVIERLVDEEISIGDYVLTGGELPAMVLVDSVVRLLPGVVEGLGGVEHDSFSDHKYLLEHPQYTRPENFMDLKVPEVLLSGNHEQIASWKQSQSLKVTKQKRPDLYKKYLKFQKD